MKTLMLVVFMSLLSVFLLAGTGSAAVGICGDGFIDPGEECDDGDTNDYNACRNDCTIYDPYFIDVPGSHWAFEFVQQLYEYAISQGYPDGTYQPGNNVSRAEMSAYIIRTIDLVGDITSVTAGTGLTGGGDSGDVTLNADTTYLQRRVGSTCSAGSSIRAINENGTVVCETDDGVGVETDPTVLASVKDGVSWAEVSGKPAGFADNVDDVGITSEDDPQVGTLTSSKWCTSNGSTVNCTTNAPVTSESDPQVGSNTINYVPKWNGSALVSGNIYNLGSLVGIGTTDLKDIFNVGGSIRIPDGSGFKMDTDNATFNQLSTSGTDLYMTNWATGKIRFYTGTTINLTAPRMEITNDGNVGIGNFFLSPPTQKLHVAGNVRIDNMFRSGSENGTSSGPAYPDSGGMIVRRIRSINDINGFVVAKTNIVSFQSDGTDAGFKAVLTDYSTIICMGVSSAGANVNKVLFNYAGTYTVYTNAQDVIYMSCSFGDPFFSDHNTQITLFREPGDHVWNGFMMSTYDQ